MPPRFSDFAGNKELVGRLKAGSLPPVALFHGPAGVGKKTLAWMLAILANCRRRTEAEDYCGRCRSCRKAKAGSHADITIIDAAWVKRLLISKKKHFNPRVIPIAISRELIKEAQYLPFEGKERFFIIDEAEKLNPPAANALLKTLEEPPVDCHFLLISPQPHQLLPTIRSRCQSFAFQTLSREELQKWLTQRMGSDEAEQRSSLADGSIGTALELDLEVAIQRRLLALELLQCWIRTRSFRRVFELLQQSGMKHLLNDREKILELLHSLERLGFDLYFLRLGDRDRVANRDLESELSELAEMVAVDWVRSFLYNVEAARSDVAQYLRPMLCLETLWLQSPDPHVGNHHGPIRSQ